MGHYLEARLTDGRAVQIDFHDNPAWKDTDRLAGRIEVSYANRPQTEWQCDDNDLADREHTVIDPAEPDALQELGKAVAEWERAGGSTRPAHPSRATWPRTSRRRNTPTGGGSPGTPTGTSHT